MKIIRQNTNQQRIFQVNIKEGKNSKKKKNSEGIKFPMLTYMGHDSIKISLNNESGHAMLKS